MFTRKTSHASCHILTDKVYFFMGNIPVNTEELSFQAGYDKLDELQTLTDTSSLL